MMSLALQAVLFIVGMGALIAHGLPPLVGAGAMALLWFVSSKLFFLAGVAGLFFFPWSVVLGP